MSEYIVATALKVPAQSIRLQIEELVLRRSRIESFGNAVFSLMLLQRFENKDEITAEFVSQSCIGACMRSVCVRAKAKEPTDVEYTHPDVQACMRVAQKTVVEQMTSFDTDQGITQIMNDSARRYLTVFTNNFSEHMGAWQRRAIIADLSHRQHPAVSDKKLRTFIVDSIISIVSCITPRDPALYKADSIQTYVIETDEAAQEIIRLHSSYLMGAMESTRAKEELKRTKEESKRAIQKLKETKEVKKTLTKKPKTEKVPNNTVDKYGVLSKMGIQKNVHLFVAYGIWLQRLTQTLETELCVRKHIESNQQQKQAPKAPFQVIPQLTLKVRFMNFGKAQMVELVSLLIHKEEVQDLFVYDKIPSLATRSAVDIDKQQHKILQLRSARDRQDDPKKQVRQQTLLDKAKASLEKLHSRVHHRENKAKPEETMKKNGVKRPRTSRQKQQVAPKRQKFVQHNEKWTKIPLDEARGANNSNTRRNIQTTTSTSAPREDV